MIVMHTIYGVTESACDCADDAAWTSFVKPISNRAVVYSYCFEYCLFPEEQRSASDYVYDLQSDLGEEFELWLINGQHQPTVEDLVVNRWRRIRLFNTMSQCKSLRLLFRPRSLSMRCLLLSESQIICSSPCRSKEGARGS